MIWTSFAHSDCRLRLKSSLHIGRNLSATIQHRTKYWQSMKQLLDSGALPTTISAPHKGADDCYFNAISLMSLKTPLRLGVQVGTLGERLQPADQNNKSSENRCTRRLTCMIQSVWLSAEYEDRDWPTGNQSKHNNDSKSVYKKTRLLADCLWNNPRKFLHHFRPMSDYYQSYWEMPSKWSNEILFLSVRYSQFRPTNRKT